MTWNYKPGIIISMCAIEKTVMSNTIKGPNSRRINCNLFTVKLKHNPNP